MWRSLALALLALVLLEPSAPSARPGCLPSRFVVQGEALVSPAVGGPAPEFIAVDRSTAGIEGSCPVAQATVRRQGRVIHVAASWPSCTNLTGKAQLRARIDTQCNRMVGTFVARHAGVKRRFLALVSRCGDGVVDPGRAEDCDDGNGLAGDGCEPDCRATPRSASGLVVGTTAMGIPQQQAMIAVGVGAHARTVDVTVTATGGSFFLCATRWFLTQDGRQLRFSATKPNADDAVGLVSFVSFGACGTLMDGVTVQGSFTEIPAWFDFTRAFAVTYDMGRSCANPLASCRLVVP